MEDFPDEGQSLFRIRSARRRKRAQKDDYDKMLLRLERKDNALYQQIQSLGWTELKPSIQRGYIRFFVLRDDVQRSKQAAFYEGILKKINTTQWCDNRTFRRKKKRKRFGKKVYAVREQNLRDVEPQEFEKRFSEKEKFYFYPTLVHTKQSKKACSVYRFVEPWRFVLRVQPDMITRVRIKDLDLEKERSGILRVLQHPLNRRRLQRLLSGNAFHWGDLKPDWYKNPLHNRSYHDILDEHWPKPTMTISIKNPRDNEGFLFVLLWPVAVNILRRILPRITTEIPPY
jgi:hypothetical protein